MYIRAATWPLFSPSATKPTTACSVSVRLPGKERTMLLDTFGAWLDNPGSAQRAADQLFVHRNTIHHRLRKFEQHTGQDLADPRCAFLPTLACEIQRRQPGQEPQE
jgi:DNA-binding PucR family transcriptional regulator